MRQRGVAPCAIALAAALAALVTVGCRGGASDEVEMQVRNLGFDRAADSPVVILASATDARLLPIWIGSTEAQSIALEMQKVTSPRPLTHDLVKRILDGTGVALRRVRITALEKQTFFARLVLAQGGREIEVDSRPSDAIALALRVPCPILVNRALLEGGTAMVLPAEGTPGVAKLWGVTVQDLEPSVAQLLGVEGIAGVLVSDAETSGRGGGLRRGDVIVHVDDVAVAHVAALRTLAASDVAGHVLEVRRGGARVVVRLTVPPARAVEK
jgi:bifunctional DNase/RNase